MPDIFQRNASTLGGVFTCDQAVLTLAGSLAVLVQQMNVTYAQTVTRLYEVGGPNVYYIGGRTQGQGSLNRVIGPSNTMTDLYTTYGNVCNAGKNGSNMQFTLQKTDCSGISGNTGTLTYTMNNVVVTQVAFGVAAQDMIISENTTLMFSSLQN